ncbi:uncharacterized protein LOC129958669 [Argiope bruennichi]|uniref:Uncharacterized protein n=1 Tax=Argiope bruennichi TaxID=94029 RepID=A0A8T0F023_ARGBR|nr:uncharacterized protein LOC129958669 [Argiope bruennichi]KAF8784417.1 hypothetical protein HNY73_010096 [Argiope bruennichi]
MALLKSCCCWRSIRSGSFASGIYTMAFYTVVVTAGSFHVESIVNLPIFLPVLLTFSILMLVFAAVSVLTSVLLIVGLCTDNRVLLIPWIVSVSMTTILDVILSLYLITDSEELDPFFAVLVVTDFLICALNVYCILCVASQYQEFSNGRNQPLQFRADDVMPVIQIEPPSIIRPAMTSQQPSPKLTVSIIPNESISLASSSLRPLLSSSELQPSGSPNLDVRHSSFSSTTEISFCSSDTFGGRKESVLHLQEISHPGLLSSGEEMKSFIDEVSSNEVEEQNNTTCLGIEVERDEVSPRMSPGASRFGVSGLFSSSIFRQIPSKDPTLE